MTNHIMRRGGITMQEVNIFGQNPRVTIEDLPPRAASMTEEEMREVFGGWISPQHVPSALFFLGLGNFMAVVGAMVGAVEPAIKGVMVSGMMLGMLLNPFVCYDYLCTPPK